MIFQEIIEISKMCVKFRKFMCIGFPPIAQNSGIGINFLDFLNGGFWYEEHDYEKFFDCDLKEL